MFLQVKNISGETDFTKRYPDCVICSDDGFLWIEETSVCLYKSKTLNKLSDEYQKTLKLEGSENQEKCCNVLVGEIKKAIKDKDEKSNYRNLVEKYGKRILLIHINDPFFD